MYEKAARKHVGGFFVGAAALSILPASENSLLQPCNY